MNRTLTVLVVPANHPDDIDAMEFHDRRSRSSGWTRIEVLHPGEPDVLVRQALDIDMGVYGAAPERDRDDDNCVVDTSLVTGDHLAYAAGLLTPHVAEPLVLAKRLIEHARTHEDPEHVARVLVTASPAPAAGRAEEAAAYIRIFLGYVKVALESGMGIAWELRTYDGERPIVSVKDIINVLPYGWSVREGKDPAPDVTWMKRGDDTMRLLQHKDSVTITITEGIVKKETEIVTLLALKGVGAWVENACALAASMRVALPKTPGEREAEQQAMIAPDVDDVLAVLRSGQSIQVGGGRSFPTYEMKNGQLIVTHTDDGYGEEQPCSVETLRAAILDAPNVFNDVIRWHKARTTS